MSLLPAFLNKKFIISYEAKDIPLYLSRDEVYRMLDVSRTNKRDHLLINLAWQSGTRTSELVNLKVQDVDFYNHLIRFITLKKGRKTRELNRTIPIQSDLIAELGAYVLENGIKDKVFDISRQRAFQIIQKRGKEAGITKKVHPHCLRHGYAVNLISQGVPISVVKDLLGHSSILTTMVYLKIVKQDAQKFLSEVQF